MMGLVIKDICVLKKSLQMFLFVTVGVMVLGVLFMLSTQYGNLAAVLEEWRQDGEGMVFEVYRMAIWTVLILPMAFLSVVMECFKRDTGVGFLKVQGSFPVGCLEVVGARYIMTVFLSAVSLTGSLFAGYMVSLASGFYSYPEICRYALGICSVLFLYNMALLPFYYYFEGKRGDTILVMPLVAVWFFCMYYMFVNGEEDDGILLHILEKISDLFTRYTFLLKIAAVAAGGISFKVSYQIEKRKGGRIG